MELGSFCHRCTRSCNYSSAPFLPPQLSLAMFPLIRELSCNFRLELEHRAVIGLFCWSLGRVYIAVLKPSQLSAAGLQVHFAWPCLHQQLPSLKWCESWLGIALA